MRAASSAWFGASTFADMLARIANLPQGRLHELLPWNWSAHVRTVAPHQAA
jgi:hypothetical protein